MKKLPVYLLLSLGILLLLQGCQYPYYTPQARKSRKEQRGLRKKIRKQLAQAIKQETPQDSANTVSPPIVGTDSTSNQNPPRRGGQSPTVVESDTNKLDASNNFTQIDSIPADTDTSKLSVVQDTSKQPNSMNTAKDTGEIVMQPILYSSDSLDVPVDYEASDSMIYDIISRKIHLYGNAKVVYEAYSLKAGYIVFDLVQGS